MDSNPKFKIIKKECVLILPSHFTAQKLITFLKEPDNYNALLEEKKKCFLKLRKPIEDLKINVLAYPAMMLYGNNAAT